MLLLIIYYIYKKKEKIYYIYNIDLSTLFAKEHGSLSLSSLKQIN